MPTPIADYFEALRHRFCAEAGANIDRARQSFEAMEEIAGIERPPASRCAFFEIAGVPYLVWQMDEGGDLFWIFATIYNIPIGILRLSDPPSGTIHVAGFPIKTEALTACIAAHFRTGNGLPAKAEPVTARKKHKLLLFGFAESFGHHFWNEIGGLAAAMETGLFRELDGIVVGPFDYFHFAPFLEAQGKPIWKVDTITPIITPDRLVRYQHDVVTEEARRLVLDNALNEAKSALPPLPSRSVCFQIRCHRRRWISEEAQLAEVIAACAQEWPDCVFYIDGHSVSKGVIDVKQEEIAAEAAIAARLAEKLAGKAVIRSLVGMDINEKINILKNVDLFAGPIGSGNVLSSWLLRKPTIVYGPSGYYDMVKHQEATVPEGGAMAFPVPIEHIKDRDDLCFDVDGQEVLRLIREIVNRHAPLTKRA
jgi:hypothetical protein